VSTTAPAVARRTAWNLAAVAGLGVAVAAVLAAYTRVHPGDGQTLFTLGFSGMLPMKAWLTTGATLLLIVQLTTALWMWGRLPINRAAPPWAGTLHRWSGTVAFLLTLPVMFHCVWALGFATDTTRTFVHSIAGCVLYGAFAAKMLALRLRGLPGWTLPVLGSTVMVALLTLFFGAALWYFTRDGVPLR
jgi:Family of unknown function (DUF6529)